MNSLWCLAEVENVNDGMEARSVMESCGACHGCTMNKTAIYLMQHEESVGKVEEYLGRASPFSTFDFRITIFVLQFSIFELQFSIFDFRFLIFDF